MLKLTFLLKLTFFMRQVDFLSLVHSRFTFDLELTFLISIDSELTLEL